MKRVSVEKYLFCGQMFLKLCFHDTVTNIQFVYI